MTLAYLLASSLAISATCLHPAHAPCGQIPTAVDIVGQEVPLQIVGGAVCATCIASATNPLPVQTLPGSVTSATLVGGDKSATSAVSSTNPLPVITKSGSVTSATLLGGDASATSAVSSTNPLPTITKAGSTTSATLLGGANSSTSAVSTTNPLPVLPTGIGMTVSAYEVTVAGTAVNPLASLPATATHVLIQNHSASASLWLGGSNVTTTVFGQSLVPVGDTTGPQSLLLDATTPSAAINAIRVNGQSGTVGVVGW